MRRPRDVPAPLGIGLFALREVTGAIFVVTGAGKFITFSHEVDVFEGFGLPFPTVMVVLAGLMELIGGGLLMLGLYVRPVALGLAVVMAVAIGTAGRTEGGPLHLGLAPALLVVLLVLVWAGGTFRSLDARH